ncbi:C3 and PZP-like alpha-2-macroglobulin domain-containing protein 8 [Eumeta japonica]|uniref:C3 and PZP-like alpha-2-macroglobulin domain-containing protein 8 n=1 Tax=Eumeta variegata TaxID=151549 RepID=A0A4C1YAM4_EUMVA|nr:C3 and PZP-like alpha-2-macroglobulin domain-containing protein 8 [Eumeta japonica]
MVSTLSVTGRPERVEVTGYSADNCSVSYASFNNETLVGSVIRSAGVVVQPEGLHRRDTQSAYFCANEHLAVSSRASWEWQWVPAPRNRAGLVLELNSRGAAHVALSSAMEPNDEMYRVVFEKSRVWIARGKHGYDVHLASAEQTEGSDECASAGGWCAWWVWWEGARLAVGRGAEPAERRLLMWPLAQDMRIKYVGFSAMWGDKADFRIWNFNEEAGFSQVLELGLPHGVVPGSASGTLLISGGLHLPLYSTQIDSDDQWRDVWRDSQLSAAAASIAPLLALEHIPHLVEDSEREKILKRLPEQVQILLSFRKNDNSFSDHPAVESHVSTIQILEILSKIQSFYPIDPELFQSIKKWVHSRQKSDGSFYPQPADKEVDYYAVEVKKSNKSSEKEFDFTEYYYYDKNGNMTKDIVDWERRVELTAETLATLLEVGVENQIDADVAKKAQTYLENNLHNVTSPAALAATVLALVLARSPAVPEALEILRNASTTEEGEFGWPAPRRDAADWLLEETSRNIKTTSYEAVTMEQYVAGVRVLLVACARGALAEGEAAARFLYYRASTLQRHPSLAYIATKAAAQYAALAHDRHRALTVSLATAGMELTDTLELRARTPSRPLQLPGLPTKVFVYATGAGCATVQGTTTYSTYSPKPENALLSVQSAIIEEIRPERSSIEDLQGNLPTLNIKTCFRWKAKERSGILRVEISLFSGYELHTVNPVVLDEGTFADMHYGSRGESVWFVFANISAVCPVCVTYQARSRFIITSLRPAFAKIYPSTRPDLAVETFFHARIGSPLLKGITDDDFITWFDKTELASLKNSANLDNICECGRLCKGNGDANPVPVANVNNKKNIKENKEKSGKHHNVNVKLETTSMYFNETVQNPTTDIIIAAVTDKSTTDVTKAISDIVDHPIIVPTVVTVNRSIYIQKEDNGISPIIPETNRGELIVQKLPQTISKPENRKEIEPKKKPLPRRKGTLKATYGDKHEQRALKSEIMMGNKQSDVSEREVLNRSQNSYDEKKDKTLLAVYDVTPLHKNKSHDLKTVHISAKTIKQLNHTKEKITLSEIMHLKDKHKLNIADINTTTEKTITHFPKTTSKVTKTKKSKTPPQIKPDSIKKNDSILNTTKNNSTTTLISGNTTKIKDVVHEKYFLKPYKSVNKEIHKISPTPISETSKTLDSTPKSVIDLAPENRDGYEILDKNSLWDLLKEVPDADSAKVDEKLHATLNKQNQVATSDNRSL